MIRYERVSILIQVSQWVIFVRYISFWYEWAVSSLVVSITGLSKIDLNINLPYPDSKVYGANMGPTWGWQDPDGPHVGHANLAIWVAILTILANLISFSSFIDICLATVFHYSIYMVTIYNFICPKCNILSAVADIYSWLSFQLDKLHIPLGIWIEIQVIDVTSTHMGYGELTWKYAA